MAFPQIADADTKSGTVTSNSNSWTLTYPTNIAAGDLLLALVSADGNGAGVSLPAGWVGTSQLQGGTAVEGRIFAKKAVGTETGNFTASLSTSEQGSWRIFRIPAATWEGTLAQATLGNTANGEAVKVGGLATGTTNAPDPGSLDPADWGIEDVLWLAVCFVDTSRTISVYPLAGRNTADVSGGAGGATLGICTTESAVGSLDPGTFTISNADDWAAVTMAIRPAGAPAQSNAPRSQYYAMAGIR